MAQKKHTGWERKKARRPEQRAKRAAAVAAIKNPKAA